MRIRLVIHLDLLEDTLYPLFCGCLGDVPFSRLTDVYHIHGKINKEMSVGLAMSGSGAFSSRGSVRISMTKPDSKWMGVEIGPRQAPGLRADRHNPPDPDTVHIDLIQSEQPQRPGGSPL